MWNSGKEVLSLTQGLQSSSFLGVPPFLVRDSNILPQKELLWSPRVSILKPSQSRLYRPWITPGAPDRDPSSYIKPTNSASNSIKFVKAWFLKS